MRLYPFLGLTMLTIIFTALFFPFPYMNTPIDSIALLLFFIVSVLLNAYPIRLKETYVSLVPLVHLFIFLQYGFLIELMVSQISLFLFILFSQYQWKIKHFFFHCLIFWMSLMSALSYYVVEAMFPYTLIGDIPLIPIVAYIATSFFTNHVILNWTLWIRRLPLSTFTWEELRWNVVTHCLAIPISALLIVVYEYGFGLFGALVITIPILIIAYIFKLVNDVEEANQQLKTIHELTSSFTSELNLEKNLDALVQAIQDIQTYDMCYIYRLNEKRQQLDPIRIDVRDTFHRRYATSETLSSDAGIASQVIQKTKPIIINRETELYLAKGRPNINVPIKSLMAVPLKTKEEVVGVIFLAKLKENGFSKKDVTLLEIMAHHAATSIHNAYIYQQTERRALKDELTGLFNYRGFEQRLEKAIEHAQQFEYPLALLILDIDYFKEVNDQFGHLTGNKVITHIATLIQSHVRQEEDVVARYGGEEFTILLPHTSQDTAYGIADRLRVAIQSAPVSVTDDLHSGKEVLIRNTVSIGVAVYPLHADDALSLVRHADRAMYVGAKQRGRNRVAVYEQNEGGTSA
ncbi:sensor domain-containing diguanylate cyclase [Caldalkalibacillus salinus]|uniref:sensor domain-containing diguanylate cyclase n=1 Tax=Caldalkalibacillus salinus TaxID=2803787 RepID=UPI001923F17E|nr:sensor domain-containing diguanylate cyclase [Caldalkalibacillus salinus]